MGLDGSKPSAPAEEASQAQAAAAAAPAPAAAEPPAAVASSATAASPAKVSSPTEKKPLPPGEVKPATGAPSESEKAGKGRGKGKGGSKQPKEPPAPPGTKLCVKNLPEDATSDSVKVLFGPHGTVTGVDVKTRGDGKCRGFGFVSFSSAEEATKAMGALNGTQVGEKELNVVIAVTKEKPDGEDSKGKGKGKKGEKGSSTDKGKGKTKGASKGGKVGAVGAVGAVGPTSPTATYNPYLQPMAMYSQYPGYGMGMYGYNPYQYQAAYQYAAASAAAAVASSPAAQHSAYSATPTAYSNNIPSFAVTEVKTSTGQKFYEGTLKSLSAKNGYGFIVCEETWNEYKRDVYVGQKELPEGAKVFDRLRFTVTVNHKKHPQAGEVTLLSSGAAAAVGALR